MTRTCSKWHKPVIGLTGGIGAGKSAAARILASLGAAVTDSDALAQEELNDPKVIGALREWWGDSVLGTHGGIDRKKLADIVFRNPDDLRRLEELVYPRIAARRDALAAGWDDDPSVTAIVIDAPKLYEAGIDELCDAVIFVDAERPVRLRRLGALRGWTEEELARREAAQNPLDEKRAFADYIVANNSSIDQLRLAVERVLASVLASFSKKRFRATRPSESLKKRSSCTM